MDRVYNFVSPLPLLERGTLSNEKEICGWYNNMMKKLISSIPNSIKLGRYEEEDKFFLYEVFDIYREFVFSARYENKITPYAERHLGSMWMRTMKNIGLERVSFQYFIDNSELTH
tara:strand:- start:178 stop:522 length:345 start_codon:yes stop_codon:yes gene_type:complete